MRQMKLKNSLLLLLTAVIWGVAFVAQSVGMDYVGPFTFTATRSIIGGLVLIPCIFFFDRKKGKEKAGFLPEDRTERKNLLMGGILCGIFLCAASNMQQIGISYTTVGKAGFITACYIVLVPVLGIFLGKKTRGNIWIAVAMAVVGLYLLCMNESLKLGQGDLYVLMCALLFAIHILVIDHFGPKTDGVRLSCIQFFVCGIISAVFMVIWEQPSVKEIFQAWMPILYAGVLSSGVGYTLQIIGQKDMNPTVASLIMSLESCISVLAGWLILHQTLSGRELIGCGIMFVAILLAQI